MGKMILNVGIAVIFSVGWVFPIWAGLEYMNQAIYNPYAKIEGVDIQVVIRQSISMGMFWVAFVVMGWSGYLAYKFFPAPKDDEDEE